MLELGKMVVHGIFLMQKNKTKPKTKINKALKRFESLMGLLFIKGKTHKKQNGP